MSSATDENTLSKVVLPPNPSGFDSSESRYSTRGTSKNPPSSSSHPWASPMAARPSCTASGAVPSRRSTYVWYIIEPQPVPASGFWARHAANEATTSYETVDSSGTSGTMPRTVRRNVSRLTTVNVSPIGADDPNRRLAAEAVRTAPSGDASAVSRSPARNGTANTSKNRESAKTRPTSCSPRLESRTSAG